MDKLLAVFNEDYNNSIKSAMTSIFETNVPGSEIKFHEANGYIAENKDGEAYENIHINADIQVPIESLLNWFK